MKIQFSTSIFFSVIIMCCSCASSYKAIHPSTVAFPSSLNESNFSCRFDVLREAGNRKMAKKEDRRLVRVVAVKIMNQTNRTLQYGNNFKIYSEDREIEILAPADIMRDIRQSVPSYLLYMAFTPTKLTITSANKRSSFPLGFILGPALTGLNMTVAASANKHFRTELEACSILNREIMPGETFYGLVGIYDNYFFPLTMKIVD